MKDSTFYKCFLTLIICCTLATNSAFAQDWTKGGNFASANPPILGTLGVEPLRLFTTGIERMRITETGNVGIGLLTPLSKFHVHDLAVPTWMQVTNDLSGSTKACELVLQPLVLK